MKNFRVIPKIEIKNNALVKGIQMEGLRVLGDPAEFARYYYENGADEIILIDVVASLYGRNSLTDLIRDITGDVFIPITVGGGVRTKNDVNNLLKAGADRISINTSAVNDPNIIEDLSNEFGSSTIMVMIEAFREQDGQFYCYTDFGRQKTNKLCAEWINEIPSLGAGEIVISSVANDGTFKGFESEMMNLISPKYPINTLVSGGFSGDEDAIQAATLGFSGISLSSSLHYDLLKKGLMQSKNYIGNSSFLNNKKSLNKFNTTDIYSLKENLLKSGINTIIH